MAVASTIIAAGIGVAGALGGAALANRGASQAANAQTQAANSANATQLQIFNQQRADAEPWRQIGGQALDLMGQLYGFTPTFNPTAPGATSATGVDAQAVERQLADFGIVLGGGQRRAGQAFRPAQGTTPQAGANPTSTTPTTPTRTAPNPTEWLSQMPGYQFRMNEGTKALNTSWAANGMRESGAAEKALLRYGQDYGSNEFNNEWNRLAGLAGVGQAVNNSNNALAQNYAAQTGANTMKAGAARASSYAQQGQNTANAFGYAAGRISNLPWDSWGGGSSGIGQGGNSGLDNYRG
jgi:hypothetical protein